MPNSYNLVIIGGGSAGVAAALRAAQMGMRVVLIDKRDGLGGQVLHAGDIPLLALSKSAARFADVRQGHLADHGIKATSVTLDFAALMARKNKITSDKTAAIDALLRKAKVERYSGEASFKSVSQIVIETAHGPRTVETERTLIATGTTPRLLNVIERDGKKILSVADALSLGSIPKKMVIVGGGKRGVELAALWQRLGSQVTLVESAARLLPDYDADASKQAERGLTDIGVSVLTLTKAVGSKSGLLSGLSLTCERADEMSKPLKIATDLIVMASGRIPELSGLNLRSVGITSDEAQGITVNSRFQTNIKGIYAAGSVTGGPALPHKAVAEAIACVEGMAGQACALPLTYPKIIYGAQEIVSIGLSEDELKKAGIKYKIGKVSFTSSLYAVAESSAQGQLKLIADAESDQIIAALITGDGASHLAAELSLAMEYQASAEDLYRTPHLHPSLGELIRKAALSIDKRV